MAGRLLLYSLPLLMITAGWLRGCRPGERFLVNGISAAAGATLVASMALLQLSGGTLAAGTAYAAMAILTGTLAMILRRLPEGPAGGGGAGGGPEPGPPPPFDWDDFERRFWADVARRRVSSGGGRPASARPPSPSRSARSCP